MKARAWLAPLTFTLCATFAAAEKILDPFAHVDRPAMQAAFTNAIPAGLEWLGDSLATGRNKNRYWLAWLRAKESGSYILHHRCLRSYSFTPTIGRATYDYAFDIGEQGKPRIHHLGPYVYTRMSEPLANVHDVIVLPFEVNQNTSKHSFSWERPLPADLKNEEAIADKRKQLRELVNLETKAINGAAAHLALCQTRYSSPTRDHLGLSTSAMISAWFEAVREGSVLLKTGPLGGNQSQAVPLFIAKQAAPLCVVAHCTSGREIGIGISDRCTDTAGVPVNDLYPVRLGDLLDLQCWEHRSSFKHPVPPPALCTTTMSVQVEFGMHGATHLINAADPPSTK